MLKRMIVIIDLALTTSVLAGFNKIDFIDFIYKYKNIIGETRHHQVSVPMWDDNASWFWFGYPFLQAPSERATAVTFPNGTRWIGMNSSDQVRGIWYNPSSITYGSQWVVCKGLAGQPSIGRLSDIFADEDGDLYLLSNSANRLIAGVIDQNSGLLKSWSGNTVSRNYAGITGIDDNGERKIITVSDSGWIYLISPDFAVVDSLKIPNFDNKIVWKIKSDGKLDQNGIATLWIQAVNATTAPTSCELIRVDIDPQSLAFQSQVYPLQIMPGLTLPMGEYPIKPWTDFVPFWVGDNDLRIVALVDDYVHIFSNNGYWLGGAWGTIYPQDNMLQPSGPLYLARSLFTDNNRHNWQGHQDLLVGDDFEQEGHGIQRLAWTPDGYFDYLALKVMFKDVAQKTEQMSKPVIQIINLSSTRQLHNFKMRLWYSRQENYPAAVQADPYHFWTDSTVLASGCQNDNPNLCWTDIIFDQNNGVIDPGDSSTIDGMQLGLHFSNWASWDKTNDFSWQEMNSTFQANQNITIYEKGVAPDVWIKIWGNEPLSSSVPLPYGWRQGPPLVDNSAQMIMSFDDLNGWGLSSGSMQLNTQSSAEGVASIQVTSSGWNLLESRPFPWNAAIKKILLAVYQPGTPLNPGWTGQVQIYVESKSLGVYNQWVGQVDLTSTSKGTWTDLTFRVPDWISCALGSSVPDLVVRIALNVPNSTSGYSVDDLRFLPQ